MGNRWPVQTRKGHELAMNAKSPSFTSEAIIALAAGYQLVPPPLLLLQLGLDPAEESAEADYRAIIERGSRSLASLHAAAHPDDELKTHLKHSLTVMCEAPQFVSLRRTDEAGSRVLYCADTVVLDEVEEIGNHRLQGECDASAELERFFGAHGDSSTAPFDVALERFTPGAQADDEDPLVTELASEECPLFILGIGRPQKGELEILQWRAAAGSLFLVEFGPDIVRFTPTSSAEAASVVFSALDRGTEQAAASAESAAPQPD